jgi:hypothetical protein
MDFNYFTWVFNLALVKPRCFAQSFQPTPPDLSHVAPTIERTISMQRGLMLWHDGLYILSKYGIMNAKKIFGCWKRGFVMWGAKPIRQFPTLCVTITIHAFNIGCWNIPSPAPKVPMTIETWESNIGIVVTRCEMWKIQLL